MTRPAKTTEHRIARSADMLQRRAKVGYAVVGYRTRMNLSQPALAEQVGCSPKTISGLERGVVWPSLPLYLRLMEVFGLEKPGMT